MGKSQRLRVVDVKNVYRLIGECRDLGWDPVAWRRHMAVELARMVGAQVVITGETAKFFSERPVVLGEAVDLGWNGAKERDRWLDYMRLGGPQIDLLFHEMMRIAELRRGEVVTRTRSQLVDDRTWYSSEQFNEYRKLSGLDRSLNSLHRSIRTNGSPRRTPSVLPEPLRSELLDSFAQHSGQDGADRSDVTHLITLHRAVGKREFSERERQLVHFFHCELTPLLGYQLAGANEPSVLDLAPRVQQTLACLLEGDSEKQVALRLNLSSATVHQYVTMIYRHFGVNSRSELMARWIRGSE